MSQESDVSFVEEQPQSPTLLIAPEMRPCPECHGEMVEGWVPSYISPSGVAGKIAIVSWHPGSPHTTPGMFRGVHVLPPNQKEAIPIRAFRCVRCGFLKFYARAVG